MNFRITIEKKHVLICVALLLVFALTACKDNDKDITGKQNEADDNEVMATTNFPLTVTIEEKEITIEKNHKELLRYH